MSDDFSGTVEEIVAGARGPARGDAVFGVTHASFTGAHAEYAIAEAGRVARKPRRSSHGEAASVPLVAVSAWQMLFAHARVGVGQTVRVHGGAGNVGSYGVRPARRAGARGTATAGGDAQTRSEDTPRA